MILLQIQPVWNLITRCDKISSLRHAFNSEIQTNSVIINLRTQSLSANISSYFSYIFNFNVNNCTLYIKRINENEVRWRKNKSNDGAA